MTCLLHPVTEAAGACEYCAQPHCAACLRTMLGRRYCPTCFNRVNGIAGGAPQRAVAAAQPGGIVGVTAPKRAGPAVPGWLSALLYMIGFYLIEAGSGFLMTLLLGLGQAIRNPGAISRLRDGISITDASVVGMPAWVTLFLFTGWGTLLVVLAFTAVMSHLAERRRLTELGLAWTRSVFRDAPLGLLLAAVLFVSSVGVGLSLGWYQLGPPQSWGRGLLTAGLGFVILLPFAAVEEVCIRGYVLAAASRSWGPRGGLLFSALVFAALHSLNPHIADYPLAVVGLILAGLYLGLVVRVTGNLWLAIFLHTGWNLMEGPIFGLPVSGMDVPASVFRTSASGPDFWTGGSFGPEAGMLLCFLLIIHLAALWAVRPWVAPAKPPSEPDSTAAEAVEPRTYRAIPLS
jgi:membrane protease YdiL (CAAX protease family)